MPSGIVNKGWLAGSSNQPALIYNLPFGRDMQTAKKGGGYFIGGALGTDHCEPSGSVPIFWGVPKGGPPKKTPPPFFHFFARRGGSEGGYLRPQLGHLRKAIFLIFYLALDVFLAFFHFYPRI